MIVTAIFLTNWRVERIRTCTMPPQSLPPPTPIYAPPRVAPSHFRRDEFADLTGNHTKRVAGADQPGNRTRDRDDSLEKPVMATVDPGDGKTIGSCGAPRRVATDTDLDRICRATRAQDGRYQGEDRLRR